MLGMSREAINMIPSIKAEVYELTLTLRRLQFKQPVRDLV